MEGRWDAESLLDLSNSYWQICALHAAVRLNVFSTLGGRTLNGPQLAAELDCDERAFGMLLSALVAMGLLVRREGAYANTPEARELLCADSPAFLGHILSHHHFLMDSWAHLDRAVASGRPIRKGSAHEEGEKRESFLLGMYDLAMRAAPQVARGIDLSGHRRLLDLGGGPGTYAVHFCRANPQLDATVFDLPTSRPFAERTIKRFGLSERIGFAGGDFLSDVLPGGNDVAWLSHILHGEAPADAARVVAKAAAALSPGGLILIHEFILDDGGESPLFPALFSLNMLLGTTGGQAYTQTQLTAMLQKAGARNVRRLGIPLRNGAGVLAGDV